MDTKALRQKILDLAIRGKLVPQDPNDEPAYILLKRIRAEKQQMVKEFSNKNNYEIRTVNPELNNIKCDLNKRIVPSVEEWLIAFRDSDFIITDSFHACVFSILYQKPFAVIVNNERGSSRFLSLLSMFGLTDRMVNCLNDIESLEEIENKLG